MLLRGRVAAVLVAAAIGVAAATAGAYVPHAIRLAGVEVGDIATPIAGITLVEHGQSPYSVRLRGSTPSLYPFTAMIALWPLHALPLRAIAPAFIGIGAFALAFAILRNGEMWQLLIFFSPAYWSSVQAVQWAPILTAAILLPPLLPLALIKPQLGVVLAACGRWSRRTIAATAAFLILSLIVWPRWPIEWLRHGNLRTFNGYAPVMIVPGIVLLFAAFAWRTREGRLLLAMAVVVQRYFYDQLPLYLVARTWRQMVLLLLTSWGMVATVFSLHWLDLATGIQRKDIWIAVVIAVFLPALGLVLYNAFRRDATS